MKMCEGATSEMPARIWVRVDAIAPLACSVRFVIDAGEGRGVLQWNPDESPRWEATMREGVASGLSARALGSLVLSVCHIRRGWSMHAVEVRPLLQTARDAPGTWVEVPACAPIDDGITDVRAGIPDLPWSAIAEETSPDEHREAALGDIRSLWTTAGTPSAAEPMSPPAVPKPESALVRALVQRIRMQEAQVQRLEQEVEHLARRLGGAPESVRDSGDGVDGAADVFGDALDG